MYEVIPKPKLIPHVTDEGIDGCVRQSFSNSSSEGPDKNAAFDTKASERWNRTTAWCY